MAKPKKLKRQNKSRKGAIRSKEKSFKYPILTSRLRRLIMAVLMFVLALLVSLSFFSRAGKGGKLIFQGLEFLIGKTLFFVPLLLILGGILFLKPQKKRLFAPIFGGLLILILGICGLFEILNLTEKAGGVLGYLLSWPFLNYFGMVASLIVFSALIVIGGLIFWEFFPKKVKRGEEPELSAKKLEKREEKKPKIEVPELKIKTIEIPEKKKEEVIKEEKVEELGVQVSGLPKEWGDYKFPTPELLDQKEEKPSSGDTDYYALVIKKTLQNFGIEVEMSEINIGPTVTQYTLKPAEGVKLSKITALSNDLALALASHPLRIEAPIPGRSLVGIEVPNKIRAKVKIGNLIKLESFQKSPFSLYFALGKDVMGKPIFTDLDKMPHLLVAGATGTGKTCAADTLMFTERGMLTFKELYSLPLNSEIDFKIKLVTRDGIEETAKSYNNGICQFYKLITRRGYQVEATAEHPLWVMNEDGSQSWKPASLIKKGDYVAISRGPALFGNKVNLSDFKPSKIWGNTKRIYFPSRITPQLAQFLGLLTADGGLSIERRKIHRVVYSQANSKLLSLYKKLLRELFGITQFIEKRSGSRGLQSGRAVGGWRANNKAKDIEVNNIHLKEFLTYLGMKSIKAPQKEIPRAIREAPKEIVAAYLRAVFDNEGYVGKNSIELCIRSKKLASQVHFMLLNFGIVSSLLIKKVKNYTQNDYYRLSIFGQEARKFVQEIGFIRKEKYNKVKEFLKLSPNPNVDLIPHISSFLKRMGQKYLNCFARLTNRGWQYQSGVLIPKHVFSSLRTYNSGFRAAGYQSLEKILDFYQPISQESEYQELEKISKRNFYWDKVEKIERTVGVGYDFYVPGSDSFIGNGFVNHNTICLNSLILSLIYRNSPKILKLILIDPKRVEFPVYSPLPHLLTPVVFEAQKVVNILNWLVKEMERRFEVLKEAGARDIASFNKLLKDKPKLKEEGLSFLSYIILIIDELADLMSTKGREIEAGIVRLSQLARAVGIHLVVATQRPSVEVITGLIKANITSRIAFQVASQVDSRTILDMAGAEKLLGRGDMLFLSSEFSRPKRIQGSFVSSQEIKKVVNFIKKENVFEEREELGEILEKELEDKKEDRFESFFEEDLLYEEAKKVVVQYRKASASLLQRRLKIGYARAARLLDILEEKGIVGPADGAKPREVYLRENPRF
ncbi:MAG: DNA translocase FtsK [Patescibacteria group bacterium]|nr:DNA translocase FtsK [Patescibacteria group bacterium]